MHTRSFFRPSPLYQSYPLVILEFVNIRRNRLKHNINRGLFVIKLYPIRCVRDCTVLFYFHSSHRFNKSYFSGIPVIIVSMIFKATIIKNRNILYYNIIHLYVCFDLATIQIPMIHQKWMFYMPKWKALKFKCWQIKYKHSSKIVVNRINNLFLIHVRNTFLLFIIFLLNF